MADDLNEATGKIEEPMHLVILGSGRSGKGAGIDYDSVIVSVCTFRGRAARRGRKSPASQQSALPPPSCISKE